MHGNPLNDNPRPILEHILDLRRRLIYCLGFFLGALGVCYYYSENIFGFLVKPLAIPPALASGLLGQGQPVRRLIYTGLTEAFLTYLKVAAFAAGFLSFPIILMQIWCFVAPGLYERERKSFLILIFSTPILFALGAAFAYWFVLPTACHFFLNFENNSMIGGMPLQFEAKINEYLSFVMGLIFSFGICFELPVVLSVLAKTGIINHQTLIDKWRLAVVVIFIIAALITPPDLISMLGLALPLVILYILSIIMLKFISKK